MKKLSGKLTLHKDTVEVLSDKELTSAVGGMKYTSIYGSECVSLVFECDSEFTCYTERYCA